LWVIIIKNSIFLIVDLIFIEKVSEYEILLIYVKKTYCRKGLASKLLNYISIQNNNIKLKKIFLEVSKNNLPQIKLYNKNYYPINEKKFDTFCYGKII